MPANAEMFTADTPITTVIIDPAFGQFGRLLFPVDDWYYSGDTLGELQLTWCRSRARYLPCCRSAAVWRWAEACICSLLTGAFSSWACTSACIGRR